MTTIHPAKLALPLVLAATLVTTGCARSKAPTTQRPATAAASPARVDEYPMIVRLVGRHYTVTASSGPDGVVYSAEGADGRLIVANATLDDMRLRHPEIYQQILPGIATQGDGANTRRRDTAEDASIQGPVPLGHVRQPASGMGRRGEMLLMDAARN